LNMKDDDDSSQGSTSRGMTLEMTDLRPKKNQLLREFQPTKKANQSKKKRDKRKAKKEKEQQLKAEEEEKKREKAMVEAKKALAEKGKKSLVKNINISDDGSTVTVDGKVLKKKVLPRKKIADAEGGLDWEVTEKKKTVIVEEEDEPSSD